MAISHLMKSHARLAAPVSPALSRDRKSTRLNSSHGYISYAVFCLKKKKDIHSPRMLYINTELDGKLTLTISPTVLFRHIWVLYRPCCTRAGRRSRCDQACSRAVQV